MINKYCLAVCIFLCCLYKTNAQNEIEIRNDELLVKISLTGAELQSIKNTSGKEYLWQGDKEYWEGRAPIMFPVNVRFKDERYSYKGKMYEMPRMGLAKEAQFSVINKSSNMVELALTSNKETLKYYPFHFVLKVIYRLDGNKLVNKFEVENTGTESMFFALGGHPGFRFPFNPERQENQYVFDKKYNLKRTLIENSLVQKQELSWLKNEKVLSLGDSRIPDGGMFVKEMPSRIIGVGQKGQEAFVEVHLEDFPNLNLWSPPGMPFACIEPMLGHHDNADTPEDIEKKNFLLSLQKGQKQEYQFSIVVKQPGIKEISSLKELKEAASNAKPGEILLLANGDFAGENVKLVAKGTKDKPIIIKAKNRGHCFIKNKVNIEGSYVSLKDLSFVDNGHVELYGTGIRITRCDWNDAKSGKWLRVQPGSKQVEIDHNTFRNKIRSNQNMDRGCQLLQVVVRNKNEQHHIHHNLFKDVAKGKTGNGFETLQLITENNPFDPPPGACNTLIENNLFVRCNGESEIISVKSNGNIIRRNTFRACRGGLVLRHGDDNAVVQNYLLGEGEKGSAGIRIQGTGQIVANNYLADLGSYGLGMMDGTPDDLYIRVENALICFNSFINCNKTFSIGINHSKHPNGTVPKDCSILGNLFFFGKDKPDEVFINLIQNDNPENWKWRGNIAYGGQAGLIVEGVQVSAPKLQHLECGMYHPTADTPETLYGSDINSHLAFDLYGKSRKGKSTVGAIQYPVVKNKYKALQESMVGVQAK